VFDAGFYIEKYPDVGSAGMDPLFHYIRHGWREGRNPNPGFDTRYYLKRCPDLEPAGINPLYHFITTGLEQGIRPMPLPAGCANEAQYQSMRAVVNTGFDADYYTSTWPGYQLHWPDPLDHFLLIGARIGWNPNPDFSVAFYRVANADVRTSGVNPYYHYLMQGRAEGRPARPAVDALPKPVPVETAPDVAQVPDAVRQVIAAAFDADFYLDRYRDISEAGVDPLEHFLQFGWREGRDPSAVFSTHYYLDSNPDIRACGMNPLYHYLVAGAAEGRLPILPGGEAAQRLYVLQTLEQTVADWQRQVPDVTQAITADALHAELQQQLEAAAQARLVIAFSHDDFLTSVGGVQFCVLVEQAAFNAAGITWLGIYPAQPLPVLATSGQPEQLYLNLVCNGEMLGVASAADCLAALVRLSPQVERIDLVIHALLGHDPELVRKIAARVVSGTCLYWVHDYLSICPGYNLLRNTVSYCGAPPADSMACGMCIYGEERRRQQQRLQALFAAVPFRVVCPSETARALWQQHSSLPYQALIVQPHTHFVQEGTPATAAVGAADPADEAPLRVAFIGHPGFHKGWHVFAALVRRLGREPVYEFHHFSQQPVDDLRVLHTQVSVSAERRSAMVDALRVQRIDLVILWSVWPETYCLAAHEAIAAGAVIVTGPESGHLVRLVEEQHAGLVMPDEAELVRAFVSGSIRTQVAQLQAQRPASGQRLVHSGMSMDVLESGDG
jgi:hypothetical protein